MPLIQIQEPIEEKNQQLFLETIIGIDLGTTNSLVGVVDNDQVKLFFDNQKKNIIASIVNFDNQGNVVSIGEDQNEKIAYRISSIKRLMGRNYEDIIDDKTIEHLAKNLNNQDIIYLQIGQRKISAIEIASEILKYLKKIAENNLEKPVNKAVITVPAYFDESAKNATKKAANLAGLEVVRLVNEPTAAAFAYGLENNNQGLYCVYDLGGGTFDVSILKIQQGVFKVLGVAGNNALGGDDFDKILQNKGFQNARAIKEILSLKKETAEISRSEFEDLINDKVKETINLTINLIDDLEINKSDIDGIILVGGSTRIPLIKKRLSKIFTSKKILTNLDPDRVVAIGACWQAYNLSGAKKKLLLDVNPLSLGIEMMGGVVEKIIFRNSTIPISKSKEFTTYADNQTAMKIHVTQGEREFAKDCRSLAQFEIKNIPPLKAGLARVKVTFTLDADGLLTVSAEERVTEQKQEITVLPNHNINEIQIKNILLESLENAQNDMENRLLTQAIIDAKKDLDILESDLKNTQFNIEINQRKNIVQKIEILKKHIAEKSSRDHIIQAQQDLAKVAENLILQKVNNILTKKITGKSIDEVK